MAARLAGDPDSPSAARGPGSMHASLYDALMLHDAAQLALECVRPYDPLRPSLKGCALRVEVTFFLKELLNAWLWGGPHDEKGGFLSETDAAERTRHVERFAARAVGCAVDLLMQLCDAMNAEPPTTEFDVEDSFGYPCTLIKLLCLVDTPSCRTALLGGSQNVPTAIALVRTIDASGLHDNSLTEVAAAVDANGPLLGKLRALMHFCRCGAAFEAALLGVDGISENTVRLINADKAFDPNDHSQAGSARGERQPDYDET